MSTKGQGHSLTLVQITQLIFFNFFSSITTRPIEATFYMETPCDDRTKAYSNCLGPITKMATMPIYGKILLLWNLKADDLETWYAASHLRDYQVCSNDSQGLTMTYFTARSNLVLYASVQEKVKTMDFSETIVVYDIKVGRCSQLKWVHEALWVPTVKVIHWPWSSSVR